MTQSYNPVEIQPEGSYVRGLVGALVGATIGAIAWCLVMQLGIIASLVGFAIGWLAEKGYSLCKGKAGKGKTVVLVIAVIYGVLLGTFSAYYVEYYKTIAEYAPYAMATVNGVDIPVTYSDIPALMVYYLSNDTEFLGAVIKDVVLGLLFAFIGVFTLLKNSACQPAAQPAVQTNVGPEIGKEDGNV